MQPFFRAVALLSGFSLAFSVCLRAQGMPDRVEAVRLMERANAVSHPAQKMPNYRQEITFRAYGVDGRTQDGKFNCIYSGASERFEVIFGDYHAIGLHFPGRIVQTRYQPAPPETLELDRLTPVLTGEFDKSDTIHAITAATVFGRRAKCIQFETVNGRTHQSNEICVDEELGAMVRWSVGEDLVEDTEYAQFEGMWLPGSIRHYINGKLRMEIEQKFRVIDGPIDWAALTPENAVTLLKCEQYRRPVIESAPQPAGAGAGPWYDVEVHAVIDLDGHVHEASVLAAGREDLEKQAIQIVSGWVFSPGLCDGRPMPVSADLVVHFPPQ